MMRFKNIICLLLILLATPAFAQKVIDSREATPFYYMQAVGACYSLNENTSFSTASDLSGLGSSFGFGKECTPIWGWRTIVCYNLNRGRTDWHNDAELVKFHDLELFLDGTLDFTDLFFHHRENNAFNLKGFLGLGFVQTFFFSDRSLATYSEYDARAKALYGARAGLFSSYKILDNFAISLGATMSVYPDNFNGVICDFPLDGRVNCQVGCVWTIGKGKRTQSLPYSESLHDLPAAPITLPTPIILVPVMAYVNDIPDPELEKRRENSGTAFIDFPTNVMTINPSYRNNTSELKRIESSIDKVNNDSLMHITSIDIHGYASPEGSYHNNTLLALGRTLALKEYLKDEYKFKESIFTISSTPEDWGGLENYVSSSTMPEKGALLKIIHDSADPDEKELEIKALSADLYKKLLKEVYPSLRHSDYTVHYTIRDFSVEEGRELIKTRPELLSLNEMFRVANSYGKGTKEYRETFTIAASIYPEHPIANLNAACVALENKNISKAKEYLAKAGDIPEAIHAKAVISALEGDYDTAKTLFEKSLTLGIEESSLMLEQLQ